jgi:hypothetical protein
MRVVERERQEQQFFEGEPDLEPPEELALSEIDEDAVLEEEIDNEDVLEQDVDDDLLTTTLEHLVHLGDDDDGASVRGRDLDGHPGGDDADDDEDDLDALEVDDLEDLEESLDRLLDARLAVEDGSRDGWGGDDQDDAYSAAGHGVWITMRVVGAGGPGVIEEIPAPCRPDEFVCRGCFLVRKTVQLADPLSMLCRDCAG